jgi:transposase
MTNVITDPLEQETLEDLRKENRELREIIVKLQEEIERLKELLNKNSSNSSFPSSLDRNKRKQDRQKVKSGKSRGGQEGQKRVKRAHFLYESVDEIIECKSQEYCICGCRTTDTKDYTVHQVIDLPEKIPTIVKEYRRKKSRCGKCGKRYVAPLPAGVPKGVCGLRLISFTSVLATRYRLSKLQVQSFLKAFFDIDLSVGTISHNEVLVAKAIESEYHTLLLKAQGAPVKHIDETGFKQSDKKGFAWVLASEEATVFKLDPSRGKKVAVKILDKICGIIISDRYVGYHWINPLMRQVCLAHILRDFKQISERSGASGKIGKILLHYLEDIFHHWHIWQKKPTTKLFGQLPEIIISRDKLHRALVIGSNCKNQTTSRTCYKILQLYESFWTFADVENVEPTNNFAERALRTLVIYRKLSFGVKSFRGARFIERIFSVLASINKKDHFNHIYHLVVDFFKYNQNSLRTLLAQC